MSSVYINSTVNTYRLHYSSVLQKHQKLDTSGFGTFAACMTTRVELVYCDVDTTWPRAVGHYRLALFGSRIKVFQGQSCYTPSI